MRRLVLSALALLLTGCAPRLSSVEADAVLPALFAPPTPAEVAAVEAEWATRAAPRAEGVRVERETVGADGSREWVVSHEVDGRRHVGLIRAPAAGAGERLPVLVVGHGGDRGASPRVFEGGAFAERWVQVLPAFRSECLRTRLFGVLCGEHRAEGPPSPWDRDVDDAMALLSVALGLVPGADSSRVAVMGRSRGGGTMLLMAARDRRVRAAVALYGPTDFFLPEVRRLARKALRVPIPLPGASYLADSVLFAHADGDLSLRDARLALLRRSAAHFAHRLPPTRIEHGALDRKVPVAHGQRLAEAWREAGCGPFEIRLHPEAGHGRGALDGVTESAAAFLERHLTQPRHDCARAQRLSNAHASPVRAQLAHPVILSERSESKDLSRAQAIEVD